MDETEVTVKLDAKSVKLLEEALKIMPFSRAELVSSGVISKAVERLVELRGRVETLSAKYSSIEELGGRIKMKGVPPDDHTLYNELLEWRAIRSEIDGLKAFLEQI